MSQKEFRICMSKGFFSSASGAMATPFQSNSGGLSSKNQISRLSLKKIYTCPSSKEYPILSEKMSGRSSPILQR